MNSQKLQINPSVWNYKNNSLLYEIEKSKKVPKKERAKTNNISLNKVTLQKCHYYMKQREEKSEWLYLNFLGQNGYKMATQT